MMSYVFITIGVSLITWLLMYLDSRLFDKPKTKFTYVKTIIMTNIVTLLVIWLVMWLSPSKTGDIKAVIQAGGSGNGAGTMIADAPKIVMPNTTFLSDIGEEMLSGDAPF